MCLNVVGCNCVALVGVMYDPFVISILHMLISVKHMKQCVPT